MRNRTTAALLGLVLASLVGCGGRNQPAFSDLNPVKGVVKRGGAPANGGVVVFIPEADDKGEFLINSEVGSDGTYSLSTVRTTDSRGERRPGAPAGKYKVNYRPPLGDQTAAGTPTGTYDLPAPVTVQAGSNDIPIEFKK
jgi:hypothetical protein